jgi:CBS domain containing-hemolysin-like protein
MISELVPSATSDLCPTTPQSSDGLAEEPEPPPTRACPSRDHARTPALLTTASACLPLSFHPNADEVGTAFTNHVVGAEAFVVDVAMSIVPLYAAVALAAAALGGFGAIAAASLIGYSPTRLGQLLEDESHPGKEKLTGELSARDREYFVVAAIYAAAGWVVGSLALQSAFDEHSYPWALATWIGLMLFVAGSLPGALADARAERSVLVALPALRYGWHVLRWPLALPLIGFTHLAMRALRLQRKQNDDPAEVQKQVMAAVADNVDNDELAEAERTWIGNIVTLKDQHVSTVMTPRPDIIAMPENFSLRDAVDQALEHEFSRYPVYRERIDEVVGIFYVKDALQMMQNTPEKLADTPLRSLLREPLFVPETTGAAQLLRRVQSGNQHMAIVIDEYGTTVGLATVEDLLEEIVGEIEDEYDPPTSEQANDQIVVIEAGRILEIPARTSVQDINRLLGSKLSDTGDWETVAGLVIDSCNRIPSVGESVVVDAVEFRVLEADERRVQRLRVTAITPEPAEETR